MGFRTYLEAMLLSLQVVQVLLLRIHLLLRRIVVLHEVFIQFLDDAPGIRWHRLPPGVGGVGGSVYLASNSNVLLAVVSGVPEVLTTFILLGDGWFNTL